MTYLVQRMSFREDLDRNGVDRFFSLDYMGSAEFEFGAVPKALSDLRKRLPLRIETIDRFYAVLPHDADLKQVSDFIADQSGARKMRLKESSCIDQKSINGWFCIDEGAGWAFFRTATQARLWARAIESGVNSENTGVDAK